MRLSTKLRISYVGIILVAVSLVLFLIIENAQLDLKEKIAKDFETVARIESENVDLYMNDRLAKVKALSQDKVFSSGDADSMTRYLSRMQKNDPAYVSVSLISPDGKVFASTDPKTAGSIWGSDAELFEKAKKSESGEILFKYGYGAGWKKPLQSKVFTPITVKTNRDVVYIMAVEVNLKKILKEEGLQQTIGGKPAYLLDNQSTMVVTRDGDAQIFTPLVYIQENSNLRARDISKVNGHVLYKDPVRGPIIAGYANLNENGSGGGRWSVISMAPEKEVFYPAIRLRNKMIILGVIAVLVAWGIAILVARGITRPILRLVEVTNMISKGDLSQRADINLNDEVGDLARSFNKMTDKLSMAIVARDQEIIERRNAEEKLREEMEAKAKFISLISSEFRTPLTVIREGMGIMAAEGTSNMSSRQRDILSITRKSGESLAHLVNDIVEFHGLEFDVTKLDLVDNDINEVVAEVRGAMGPLLSEKRDIKLSIIADPSLPKARFDRDRIALVLTNVLNMALRTTEKGTIMIRAARDGDNAIRVSLEDTGSTMDKDHLPTLFEKFDVPGKDRDKKAGGTGLGFTISREIIKKHNGKIWAEAGASGGVVICFVLPLSERRI